MRKPVPLCFVYEKYGRKVPCHFGCTEICRLGRYPRNGGGPFSLFNSAGFFLKLDDLGAGAVDTTMYNGAGTVGVPGTATFTRATTATTVNSAGAIVSVASGTARSYYDPTTLAYRGYLAEGARTNVALNSLLDGTDFSTQSVNVTAQAYTLSFYGTGTLTLSGASSAGPLVGTGVYPQRVTLTFTPSAASLTLTVSGSCKYVQLEAGSFASSFIPTAGTAVARNADVLTYPFAGNALAATGTAYAELSTFWAAATGLAQIAVAFTNASNNSPFLYGSANVPTESRANDGTNTVTKTGLTSMATAVRNRGTSWGAAGLVTTGDGASVASVAFDGGMATAAIGIGCDTAGLASWNGTIRNVRIWQTQLTNDQLIQITT